MAKSCDLIVSEAAGVRHLNRSNPAGGGVYASYQVEYGRLARARRAGNGDKVALSNCEGDTF